MSSSTTLTQVEDEPSNEQIISPALYQYIIHLHESPACYARFFDALLIQKASHPQLFHDLKAFREQADIIRILEAGTKRAYRQTTRAFVGSRFAHPWCRTTSDFKSGWRRASWVGTTKKPTQEDIKEEERLHRLLVPIWIAFRRRMFPDGELLEEWTAQQAESSAINSLPRAEQAAKSSEREALTQLPDGPHRASSVSPTTGQPEPGSKTNANGPTRPPNSASKNLESGAATASQMFLGAAVTGFIMSDKRVRKYVEKQLKKRS